MGGRAFLKETRLAELFGGGISSDCEVPEGRPCQRILQWNLRDPLLAQGWPEFFSIDLDGVFITNLREGTVGRKEPARSAP